MLLLLRFSGPASEQIERLTGLTGLPPFPLSLQEADFEAGPNKLIHCCEKKKGLP
jgi:hypothetical protein